MSSPFQTFRANLPPPAEALALLLGLAEATVFGLAGLANPIEFANAYGLPLRPASAPQAIRPTSEADAAGDDDDDRVTRNQKALVRAIAVRNLQNGVVLLALGAYVRDRRALGVAVAAGLVTTVGDVWIVRGEGGGEGVWGHVFGVFNCAAVGFGLLKWAREDPWW